MRASIRHWRGILNSSRIPSLSRAPGFRLQIYQIDYENELLTAECHPITVVPGLHRLFLEYCAGTAEARAFYAPLPPDEAGRRARLLPAHWPELVRLLAAQNPGSPQAPRRLKLCATAREWW